MKASLFLALAATAHLVVSALQLGPRTSNPRVLSLDIERRPVSHVLSKNRTGLHERHRVVQEPLANKLYGYYANISLGTPPQQLQLLVDTGSADTWVNIPDSEHCSDQARFGRCEGGTYNHTASSSYRYASGDFGVTYVFGAAADGDYVTDTLHMGGIQLDKFQFGIGYDTFFEPYGVLGLGYTGLESSPDKIKHYPNLPAALVKAGIIERNLFSMWLNDVKAPTGTILFGGVDKAKYKGKLHTVPIVPIDGKYVRLAVELTGVTLGLKKLKDHTLPARVTFDSGSTVSWLPYDIAQAIYQYVNALDDRSGSYKLVDCTLRDNTEDLKFYIGGAKIHVPLRELVLDEFPNAKGPRKCYFGISTGWEYENRYILGASFMRNAYVVFDLTNNEISLAQAKYTKKSDIREVNSGKAIPFAA